MFSDNADTLIYGTGPVDGQIINTSIVFLDIASDKLVKKLSNDYEEPEKFVIKYDRCGMLIEDSDSDFDLN